MYGREEAACDCCGKRERREWMHGEPPSDLFPGGRMLCDVCFNFHLFAEHRETGPVRSQPPP